MSPVAVSRRVTRMWLPRPQRGLRLAREMLGARSSITNMQRRDCSMAMTFSSAPPRHRRLAERSETWTKSAPWTHMGVW